MQYQFLNIFLDPKDLLYQAKNEAYDKINHFLLENNESQLGKIYEFYKSNKNLLYVNGFLGTGKAEIVNYSTSFLSPDTVVLKYNCFNSTVLDDILLSFFSEFKKLSSQNIISEPKVRTENFTQKINSYFAQIEKPFVIILDSFEAILDENRQEIIDFIQHLCTMQKIKVVIIARTFESKYFKDIEIERVTNLAFEEEIFGNFLKAEKIKTTHALIEELYKNTRGYYFFTALSVRLMKHEDLTLFDFLMKQKESYLPFQKYLEKQAFELIAPEDRHLFWFLCLIRHPVSIDLLKKLNFYNEERIKFLIDNLIIIQDGENIYVQDYLKEEADEDAPANILQKIRQNIVDLYIAELPLKPLERNICISRQTMRKEIEYHKLFLPKKPKGVASGVDVNYLTYGKSFELGEKTKSEEVKHEEPKIPQISPIDLTQRKNVSINLENLPYQPPKIVSRKHIEEESEKEIENLAFKDVIGLIKKAEKSYRYAKVIDLCQKALLMRRDQDYEIYLPMIYTKIAHAYQKVSEYEKALKYYELAQNYYQGAKNFIKVNHIKFNISKIYYESYRIDKAKELLVEIAESSESPTILVVKSYVQLASLEEEASQLNKAFEYYKLALERAGEIVDITILSELYFKYALIMDDKNDVKTAIEFYTKCINLDGDAKINKFLSSAYSNLATLYFEKNDIENAMMSYAKAFEIDEESQNLEGSYYSASKLASLLHKKQSEKALDFYKIALEYAEKLKDVFYIISATLAIGDYYYDKKQSEIALKYYINALDMAQNNLSQDNIYKINTRINDIKFRLGVEKFDNLVETIRSE